jgi:hypothetical protein
MAQALPESLATANGRQPLPDEESLTQFVIAGLDPAIHLIRKMFFVKNDGCAGQARA